MGNYISVSEVKSFSRVSYQDLEFDSDADYDAFLNDLIDQIEKAIENYCRVPSGFFKAGGISFVEVHDWNEDGEIHTRYYPILTLTKVELDQAGYNQNSNWTEISSDYYYVKNEYGIIKIIGKTPGHIENSVRITYMAGYSSVPDDIKIAALSYASNVLHSILQRQFSVTPSDINLKINLIIQEAFSQELRRMLSSYRRRF